MDFTNFSRSLKTSIVVLNGRRVILLLVELISLMQGGFRLHRSPNRRIRTVYGRESVYVAIKGYIGDSQMLLQLAAEHFLLIGVNSDTRHYIRIRAYIGSSNDKHTALANDSGVSIATGDRFPIQRHVGFF